MPFEIFRYMPHLNLDFFRDPPRSPETNPSNSSNPRPAQTASSWSQNIARTFLNGARDAYEYLRRQNGVNPPRLSPDEMVILGIQSPLAIMGCGARTGLTVPSTCAGENTPAPDNLSIEGYNPSSVNILFRDRSANETSFEVERGTGSIENGRFNCSQVTDYERILEIPAQAGINGVVRFVGSVRTDLARNQSTCFRVRAIFDECVSPFSPIQAVGYWTNPTQDGGIESDAGTNDASFMPPDASVNDSGNPDAMSCNLPTYSFGNYCPDLREEIIRRDPLRSLRTSPTGPLNHPSAEDTRRVEAALEREFPGLQASFPRFALGLRGEIPARATGVVSYVRSPLDSGNEILWILTSRKIEMNGPWQEFANFQLLSYEVRGNQVIRPLPFPPGATLDFHPFVSSTLYESRPDSPSNMLTAHTQDCGFYNSDVFFPSAMAYINSRLYVLNGGDPAWSWQRSNLILALNPSRNAEQVANAAPLPLPECAP